MHVIKKWGNSLALRIPAHFVTQLQMKENTAVELSISEGGLFVKPTNSKPKYLLCDLLAGIKKENLHTEIDTGEPRGAEVW